jgi:glucoamylase
MSEQEAFGKPGVEPHWSPSDKDGVGTAASAASRVWFTLWHGMLTEVFYPRVDQPQIRDLRYLITDGERLLHEEGRNLRTTTERLSEDALGYRVTNADPEGRYRIVKEIITSSRLCCVLQHTRLEGEPDLLERLHLYVLCAPHLHSAGAGNNAAVVEVAGRRVLTAEKDGVWLALAATSPFSRTSCGYAGRSDGGTDLREHLRMDWAFERATDGNVALAGELDLRDGAEFTLGLAFGASRHHAINALFNGLGMPFEEQRRAYERGWERAYVAIQDLQGVSGDGGRLYRGSYAVLLAHEDKHFPGALVAALSTPWGDVRGDSAEGYHMVWTRDMSYATIGLLAAGNTDLPLRALIYLITGQQQDGGYPQNFWVDGTPHWTGSQLDEVALPILLAWYLRREDVLRDVDPYPMIAKGVGYLIRHGPATQQARWEEAGGYSPATLAVSIGALICASDFARARGDEDTAQFLEQYADFLNAHVETWTVTSEGTLLPEIRRHFIRILPTNPGDPHHDEDPDHATIALANQPPGARRDYPAREIVSTGFLGLVRLGLRAPDDPLIVDSLRVVDAVLKVDTPFGPCWHRYNHDGYGQRDDGAPYKDWGVGRAWPLLTAERGQYEVAAGRDVGPLIRALEGFAATTGLLPEQIWDAPDLPEAGMELGRPTGSAMPLLWAHGEYVKLLRSARDGAPFETIEPVASRYGGTSAPDPKLEVWKHNRQVRAVRRGYTLRILAGDPFRLRWSRDGWQAVEETPSTSTGVGMTYVDVPTDDARLPICFTFYWTTDGRWEGQDYEVAIE